MKITCTVISQNRPSPPRTIQTMTFPTDTFQNSLFDDDSQRYWLKLPFMFYKIIAIIITYQNLVKMIFRDLCLSLYLGRPRCNSNHSNYAVMSLSIRKHVSLGFPKERHLCSRFSINLRLIWSQNISISEI